MIVQHSLSGICSKDCKHEICVVYLNLNDNTIKFTEAKEVRKE